MSNTKSANATMEGSLKRTRNAKLKKKFRVLDRKARASGSIVNPVLAVKFLRSKHTDIQLLFSFIYPCIISIKQYIKNN